MCEPEVLVEFDVETFEFFFRGFEADAVESFFFNFALLVGELEEFPPSFDPSVVAVKLEDLLFFLLFFVDSFFLSSVLISWDAVFDLDDCEASLLSFVFEDRELSLLNFDFDDIESFFARLVFFSNLRGDDDVVAPFSLASFDLFCFFFGARSLFSGSSSPRIIWMTSDPLDSLPFSLL